MERKVILWTQELVTGIAWQDYQHREFLKTTNHLLDTFYREKGHIDIEATLIYLDRYAKDHFSIEERYMEVFDYPGLKDHKSKHRVFKDFVDEMKTVASDKVMDAARICNKLNTWFVDHIKTVDKELGRFLQEHAQK
ncbi:MAG: hemerythrin family protein [Proteobacteria bacterium]|nr:hemerythrin family protein [Pseudomonadota bacterium]